MSRRSIVFAADGGPPAVLTVRAPAKLNLSLAVLTRRDDGFHEIESLMVPVTLFDTLRVAAAAAPGIRLRVHYAGQLAGSARSDGLSRDVPVDASNLVVRAAQALADEAGVRRGLDVELVKEIPSGAGLGGGSSDAAAVLLAASRAWGLDWPRERLAAIGARIGSDVPWFFAGGPAIAGGRGERLEPVAGLPLLAAVIACPAVGLSTAAVYGHCVPEPARRGEAARLAAAFAAGRLPDALSLMHNSLERPARDLCPEVDRLLADLASAGAVRPLLTGSGSACFAVTRSVAEARRIAGQLGSAGWPGVFAVRLAVAATAPLERPLAC
jgi:4-diphosphocytidyl-2-C-methyl-D-erythritol kinase